MKSTRFSILIPAVLAVIFLCEQPRPCRATGNPAVPATNAATAKKTTGTVIFSHAAKSAPKKIPGLTQDMLLSDVSGRLSQKTDARYPRFVFLHRLPNWPISIRLLPNISLATLQAADKKGREFLVSGQVTRYEGKSYLLLSQNIRVLEKRPASQLPPTAPPPINRVKAGAESPAAILAKLLRYHIAKPLEIPESVEKHHAVKSQIRSPAFSANHQWLSRPEGSYLWNRQARLLHNPRRHQWFLALESNGSGKFSPTIYLLPGPLLAKMRKITARQGTRIAFRVSGRVTQYRGFNYLFLTYAHVFHFRGRD